MKTSTNPSFKEVVNRCKRHNNVKNDKLHWFSSKFSIYISYLLIRLRVSADQATILFFLTGLAGSLLYIFVSPITTFLAYVLWRLHVIIDMSDGDVARFHQSFTVRGAYWDAVIHSVLNPLYYIFICFSFYYQFDNDLFIIVGALMGLTSSVLLATKNNYYKAMLYNGIVLKKPETSGSDLGKKNEVKEKKIKFKLIYFFSEILSIEGFIFLTIFVRLFNEETFAYILVFIYFLANILISLVKFYQFSYSGKTFTKS